MNDIRITILGTAAFTLTACSSGSLKADYMTSCMFDTNAPGSYQARAADIPVATPVPGTGATQAGADALNACIQRRAAADGKL